MWARTYTGPGNRADSPVAIAVSPNGGSVYVTGNSPGLTTRFDYATVAYDATTGRQRWARRYNGPASLSDLPAALAVGPRSGIVYVTGTSWSSPSSMDLRDRRLRRGVRRAAMGQPLPRPRQRQEHAGVDRRQPRRRPRVRHRGQPRRGWRRRLRHGRLPQLTEPGSAQVSAPHRAGVYPWSADKWGALPLAADDNLRDFGRGVNCHGDHRGPLAGAG